MAYRRRSDEKLLLALACGASVESAARSVGVSPRTAHRRLKDPEFQRQLGKLKRDMMERASSILAAGTLEAAKSFLAFQDPSTPQAVRLGAARSIFQYSLKVQERLDFEERITALENSSAKAPGKKSSSASEADSRKR
jgi:hypothetical protein